jgi:squalene-hopene/tetraprenyl-beta-curcumene cyclase
MALVAAGEKDHPVVKKAAEFLLDTVRPDGSWPIDTNLATWATTLSVKALLGKAEAKQESWVPDLTLLDQREALESWLLAQQYKEVHPFTDTPPGGWAWTDLSGGVPDADDTPGALLALKLLEEKDNSDRLRVAAAEGIEWLVGLQNRDGGIPTFCKGWGALPFDRSSPDLTAHTLRAMAVWRDEMSGSLIDEIDRVRKKGLRYLFREQRPDGSWVPLWFGNQHRHNDEENPTYGTAMVLRALDELGEYPEADEGAFWLMDQQNDDGGWGASQNRSPSTIEETALAVGALAWRPEAVDAVRRGRQWLIDATQSGTTFDAAPIGFYFARLWYYERVYPIVWSVEALTRSEGAIEH